MKRILLILEEVKEMIYLETFLRKFRFDVQSLKANVAVLDKYTNFRPDVMIMTARGKKVNGIDIAKKINPKGENTKIFLAISGSQKIKPTDLKDLYVAGYMESPINPAKCVELIAQHLKMDMIVLRDNFERANKAGEKTSEEGTGTWVKGKIRSEDVTEIKSDSSSEKAESKYVNNKLLDFKMPEQQRMDHERIQKEMARIRQEGEEPELDEARKEFVRQLYKK